MIMNTFDVCIPVYRGLRCLQIAALGIKHNSGEAFKLGKVYLHIQDPEELIAANLIFDALGIPVSIASVGNTGDMATHMDKLYGACQSDWVVMMEQDTFMLVPFDNVLGQLQRSGFTAAGAVDTFMYDHPNSRQMPKYGTYARLSPAPGYFHSSLIFIDRTKVLCPRPFTVPQGFRFHGYGCLGAEPYYGLRLNLPQQNRNLCFLRQQHFSFGYSASICLDVLPIAVHLYYSGTKHDYVANSMLGAEEFEWICSEEKRFLQFYRRELLGEACE